jgi:hypothetical protein
VKSTIHEPDGFFNRFFVEKVDDITDRRSGGFDSKKRGPGQSFGREMIDKSTDEYFWMPVLTPMQNSK